MHPIELSPKSRAILTAIAAGRSYEEILAQHIATLDHDIFLAAAEALEIIEKIDRGKNNIEGLAGIREANPRAYDKWTTEEEAKLVELFQSGISTTEIAQILQRQPGAIRSRLTRLNLIERS